MATSLDVPYRVFGLDNLSTIESVLEDEVVKVLINCVGPFAITVEPLVAACIEAGVHYLDISAELDSYQLAMDRADAARKVNVMLLPGCSGSVAMLCCLAAHAVQDIQSPARIDVALRVAGPMSRGSVASAASSAMTGAHCLQRLDDRLVPFPVREEKDEDAAGNKGDDSSRQFDFDNGDRPVSCFPVTLPDLITIGTSTGVANIRTFACVGDSGTMSFPDNDKTIPDGPTAEEREANPYHAVVAVTDADGGVGRAVLHTVNGYTFSAMPLVEAARRALAGEVKAGFKTPATLFGKDFVDTFAESQLVDTSTCN